MTAKSTGGSGCVWIPALIVLALMVWVCYGSQRFERQLERECAARGGETIELRARTICVKKGTVLQ